MVSVDHPSVDLTTIGRRLRSAVIDPHLRNRFSLIRSPSNTALLASFAVSLAIRRRFATDAPEDVVQYVRQALSQDTPCSSNRLRVGTDLITTAFTRSPGIVKLDTGTDGDVVYELLVYVVRDLDLSSTDTTALIATAEQRLCRYLEAHRRRGILSRMRWRSFIQQVHDRRSRPGSTPSPQTHMGRVLRALAAYDYAEAQSVPDELRSVDDQVLDHAFQMIVRKRFPRPDYGLRQRLTRRDRPNECDEPSLDSSRCR